MNIKEVFSDILKLEGELLIINDDLEPLQKKHLSADYLPLDADEAQNIIDDILDLKELNDKHDRISLKLDRLINELKGWMVTIKLNQLNISIEDVEYNINLFFSNPNDDQDLTHKLTWTTV